MKERETNRIEEEGICPPLSTVSLDISQSSTEATGYHTDTQPSQIKKRKDTKIDRDELIKGVVGLIIIIASISVYFLFRTYFIKIFHTEEAFICCIISLVGSAFWSLHVLRLETTSLALIPVIILFNIMVPDRESFADGTVKGLFIVCKILVSPVLMLLMGSCLLSVYFQNNGGDRIILPYLVGSSDVYTDLFRSMFLSVVLSAVMSNITAPIIITSVLQNRSKPPRPSVLMGVAMASNIGGMILPISSPQSILGSSIMNLSWIEWIVISVPTASVCFLFVYALVVLYFPKGLTEEIDEETVIEGERSNRNLLITTLFSIVCWSVPSVYKGLSFLYAVPVCFLIMAKGSEKVFNRKTLEILSIAVAGTAIGKAIEETKMLEGIIAQFLIKSQDKSILFLVVTTSFIMLVISCMVCHTVSAIVILPIYARLGLLIGKSKLIVGVSALACSCGMAFPSSGFPNILSSTFKGQDGKRVISTGSFVTVGSISTIGCWLFILAVSLLFMLLENF